MGSFFIKQGDRLPVLAATLYEAPGEPMDLTGHTVTFVMGAIPGTHRVASSAVVVDAASGKVEYQWADGDTGDPGAFLGEFIVTEPNGDICKVPQSSYINVTINARLSL